MCVCVCVCVELTEKMDETAVVQSEGILSHAYHPSEEEGEEEEEDGSEVEEEMVGLVCFI